MCSNLLIKQKPKVIRIALHPRDPNAALEQQKGIIRNLKDQGYRMPTYAQLIPELLEIPSSMLSFKSRSE